ncbi:colicin immunity domain-containing protein [Rhodococcoides fascians]|uniref:colicin immunity domain-containing protein n=1 Tax=Rhodococcoides fascians TaxID=1828 RepID=UPI0012D30FE0
MSAMGRVAEQALIFVPTIEAFVDGSCTADDFEEAYSRLVKRTPGILQREVSEIVNGLFGDVDAYVAHPNRGCRSWGLKPPVSSRLRAM